MLKQLTLGVGLKDEATFANFYAGANGPLLQALNQAASGRGEHVIYISGSGGQGRTHLLQACCHEAYRHHLNAAYVPLADFISYSPEVLEGLENRPLVCLDDVQTIVGHPQWEEALFHAYNRIHEAEGRLIITGNAVPKVLGLSLPDLVSRLSWGVTFVIQPLSDTEKLAALTLRAECRGLTLSEEVGKFILNHCPRHMSTLFAALDALDKASLAAQRKLTIPFVKTVLQI